MTSGEFPGDQAESIATGEKLRTYLEEQIAAGNEIANDTFVGTMTRLLADRLGNYSVVPLGFITATELLTYDCQKGVSGFTGEPMPREVTDIPPMMFGLYRTIAEQFARGAFGDAFADEVRREYDRVLNRASE